jgi:hypothetical protein
MTRVVEIRTYRLKPGAKAYSLIRAYESATDRVQQ